jgi:transcriptional regulator with XRE-family HTH domain
MKLWSSATLVELMRSKNNMQTQRLAHYAKCSPAMVSHLRSGRKTSCSDDLAEAIAEALGVPTSALFDPSTATGRSRSKHMKKAS